VTYLAVLLLWLAAGYRLSTLRRSRSYVTVSFAAAAAGAAAAFTVKATEAPIDAITGPYVSDLIEHGLVVVAGAAAQLFLLALRTGRPPRRAAGARVAIAAVVAMVMVVTFLLAPVHQRVVGDLDETYGQLAAVAAYRLVFDAYLTYVLVDNVRLCRRYAAIRGDFGRSTSLTLVGWGSAVALAYSGSRIIYILIDVTLHEQPTVIRAVGSAAATLGLCALAVGMLTPRAVSGARGWLDARRGTRRLGPLWHDLTTAFPVLALRTRAPFTPRRAELRYDRRLVEVGEGLVKARIPAAWVADVAGTPDPIHALAVALRRNQVTWADAGGIAAADLLPHPGDLPAERQQILAFAQAYTSAPAEPVAAARVRT